jgi:N-acetylglutamate synthase-like GNAT family acetyltransferase
VQIRIARIQDVERIVELINAAFRRGEGHIICGDRIDSEEVRSLLPKGEFLVAEEDGKLVGCVYLEPRQERTYLGLLSVSPDLQKQGVGSWLMREAEQRRVAAGCRFIDLRTINLRQDNRAFYQRRGYVETGTAPFPADVPTKLPCHFVHMSKSLP